MILFLLLYEENSGYFILSYVGGDDHSFLSAGVW